MEAREITAAKEAARSLLNDPDSAQFRNLEVHSVNDQLATVCGEVNARNRMGGYSGFERFAYVLKTGQIEIDTKASTPDGGGLIIAPDQAERQIRFNRLYIEHCISIGL
jgi:hypothetical protein